MLIKYAESIQCFRHSRRQTLKQCIWFKSLNDTKHSAHIRLFPGRLFSKLLLCIGTVTGDVVTSMFSVDDAIIEEPISRARCTFKNQPAREPGAGRPDRCRSYQSYVTPCSIEYASINSLVSRFVTGIDTSGGDDDTAALACRCTQVFKRL